MGGAMTHQETITTIGENLAQLEQHMNQRDNAKWIALTHQDASVLIWTQPSEEDSAPSACLMVKLFPYQITTNLETLLEKELSITAKALGITSSAMLTQATNEVLTQIIRLFESSIKINSDI